MKYYTVSAVSNHGLRYHFYVDSDEDIIKGPSVKPGMIHPCGEPCAYHMRREHLSKLFDGSKIYGLDVDETFHEFEIFEWDPTLVSEGATKALIEETKVKKILDRISSEEYELLREHFKET
ncbi:hypothetical protein PP747_gp013 [Rhizobium phage RHph_Y38]|uniref:Uncharacterized protein n=2 Tax=Acanvirus TaxID=3044653 RepID=A0A7S5R8I5_9CAUD|nr:hypothetical protein PP747_gp013 [Rhizobium phage RHph_Y38]YP_010658225.1 hypothetical protein PP749_gp014 [Rhizobium phage RHEph22]QIG67714.1 hypothetical protein EVB52_013 [Rhizobium phage RHph_Y38]QXV74687.1 hypothetical protein [Rhizobium phage RHEph22]